MDLIVDAYDLAHIFASKIRHDLKDNQHTKDLPAAISELKCVRTGLLSMPTSKIHSILFVTIRVLLDQVIRAGNTEGSPKTTENCLILRFFKDIFNKPSSANFDDCKRDILTLIEYKTIFIGRIKNMYPEMSFNCGHQ